MKKYLLSLILMVPLSVFVVAQDSESEDVEEVVVTGITSRDRKRLTSGSVVVGSELIEGVAVSSPDQALMGRVSGLRIVGVSGTPGANQQIRIRGEGSITGNNAPTFVIDGYQRSLHLAGRECRR